MWPRLSPWVRRSGRGASPLFRRRRSLPFVEELESRLAPSVGPNVPVATGPGVQQMPSIVADPHDPSHLVVAYLDYSLLTTGYAGIGVAVSDDGGTTWQHSSVPLPSGFDQGAATPVAQFDTQGHVFVSFAAATFLRGLPPITDPNGGDPRALGLQSNNGIFVARSDDGGLTWNPPAVVASHLYDGTNPVPFEIKPDLAIDTFQNLPTSQPNPYYGDLYEVWSRYYPAGQFPNEPNASGGSAIMLAVSRDAGRTWQIEPQPITATGSFSNTGTDVPEGEGLENWAQAAVGAEGDIDIVEGTGQVTFYRSTDGGASFTQPNVATGFYFPFGNLLEAVPSLTLANDQFRTQTIHEIATDPMRPGNIYIVVSAQVTDRNGDPVDSGDVLFARSTNYGATWQTTFQVGPDTEAGVLNDDNGGEKSTGAADDVADGQALPRLVTDAQGDVGVIWYDTRHDPSDTLLDVYGTVSRDGGQTFSPNFRVTDQSFNPNLGAFSAADGSTSYYLGDALGLAMANGIAYATWTDTRNGNQDVYFASVPINPPPQPSNRFGPNATAATATDLGKVVTRALPRLTIAASDEEWFQFQAAATGSLTITATLAVPADSLRLELYDAGGTTLLAGGSAVLNAEGQGIGQSLTFAGQSGQIYLVRVLPGPAATADQMAVYTLNVQSLTADLGTRVYGVENGTLVSGQDAYYALSVPASGALEVTLTPGTNARGNFHLELLDPSNLSVLASGQAAGASQQASLAPTQGQAVYLHVFGDAGAQGDFSLEFINPDQFTTPDNQTLFFPTGGDPSQAAVADLNDDGKPDIVVDYADQNFVSVLLNNGDGTFQAPRDYAVGVFQAGNNSTLGGVPDDKRALVIADFTGNGIPDIAALDYQTDDISLLLGRGDGTFAPQRVIGLGSLTSPFALAAGDLNNDGIPDLAVVGSTGGPAQRGDVLLGRGDGTFEPPIPFTIPSDPGFPTNTVQIADFNHDGKNDLVYEGFETYVLLGNGDGSFRPATPVGFGVQGGLVVADLNGDGNPDIITTAPTSFANGAVEYALGNGDGSFQPQVRVLTGQAPIAVAVADLGSQVTLPDGSTVLGPPDGIPDLIVANNGIVANFSNGPPDVVIVPGLADAQGQFDGFGSPFVLAAAKSPLDLQVADLTGGGTPDVVIGETGGIEVIYGKPLALPPNTTPQSARNLGTVVHLVEPTQTIVPGHEDANYTLTAPAEAVRGPGNEVLDFSGLFQGLGGAGLSMAVTDAAGNVLGSGERFRIEAIPGAVLTLHVFGVVGAGGAIGTGAYTLDIDALPQLVSVQAEALLSDGPTASLVLTFQGDRLDPSAAEIPANYTITWRGPDGNQVMPVQTAVYDPGANIDVATGITYPTAIRQTVTLLFAQPLPAGSYEIALSPAIQAAPFNPDEDSLLAPASGITGHELVSAPGGTITAGDDQTLAGLVPAGGAPGGFSAFKDGTPFLTQLHDDLGALLDADLTQLGDAAGISAGIDRQIVDRITPALGSAGESLLVIWLDPVPVDVYGPGHTSQVSYDPGSNGYRNSFATAFASVAGNVELLVLPFVPVATENNLLSVAPTAEARGGAVYFGPDGTQVQSLTAALRAGTDQFLFSFVGEGSPAPAASAGPAASRDPSGESRLSIATLLAFSDAPAVRPPLISLAPLEVSAVGEATATVGVTAVPTGAPLSGVIVGQGSGDPPGPPFNPRVQHLIEVVTRLVEQVFPGLRAPLGRWLRLLLRAGGGGGGRAAVAPPAAAAVVEAAPVPEELAPPADGVVVPERATERAGGGSWAWAALLGGLLLPGVMPSGRGRGDRKRPRLP